MGVGGGVLLLHNSRIAFNFGNASAKALIIDLEKKILDQQSLGQYWLTKWFSFWRWRASNHFFNQSCYIKKNMQSMYFQADGQGKGEGQEVFDKRDMRTNLFKK